ncbi:MFS transporter [Arthrobacter sp. CAU 1506]|uniref:MFS transporter n=1 Tax=Arthrobacter sp. CAU 1506 TaxID=2560052 RepID=UPI00145E33F1|nr:MFS transporter [Arthrobacter sp. CAU 1506]
MSSAGSQRTADVGSNRQALAVAPFRRLALAWLLTNLGDSALFLTAAIWTKTLTGSDAAAGLVFAAFGAPALFASLIGQLADRYSRRRLMVLNNVVAAAVVLALLLVQDADQFWLVYLVLAAYAASSYLTAAAQGGLLRDLMPDRLLAPANGLLSTIDQGLRIVAPLAGAGIFALWGMAPVIAATCVSFLAAAAVMLTVRVSETQHEPEAGETFWSSSLAGFRFLWRHRQLRPATLTLMIAVAATGILNVTLFAAIEQGVGLPPESLALFSSVQGVFSVLGGLTAAGVIRMLGLQRTMALGLVLLGVAIPLLASNSVALFLAAVVLVGCGVMWTVIAYVTLRQTESPARLQGRTGAAANLLLNLPQVMAALGAAALIGFVDYRVLMLAAGAGCLLSILPMLRRASRPTAKEPASA